MTTAHLILLILCNTVLYFNMFLLLNFYCFSNSVTISFEACYLCETFVSLLFGISSSAVRNTWIHSAFFQNIQRRGKCRKFSRSFHVHGLCHIASQVT